MANMSHEENKIHKGLALLSVVLEMLVTWEQGRTGWIWCVTAHSLLVSARCLSVLSFLKT